MNSYKIGILDDHYLIIEAIKTILSDNDKFKITATFLNYKDFENYYSNNVLEILILDIQLNNDNGLELCKKIKKKWPSLKIVMLSNFSQKSIVKEALENGADGFMIKSITKNELINCFEEVINDKTYLHDDIKKIANNELISKYDIPLKLTRREKEVLQLILNEYTTKKIAEKLFISPFTVETHRNNLFVKTGAKNLAGLIRISYEKGLLDN